MKFAVFALYAGLCLTAVTANVVPIDDFDTEFLSTYDSDLAVKPYSAFGGIYWVLKAVLKSQTKVQCAIQGALQVQTAAQQFIDVIQTCPGIVTSQVQAIITSSQNVVSDVNNIIDISTNTCSGSADTSSRSSNTGWNCFWNLLKGFNKLVTDIQRTLKAINKLPTTGPDATDCVTDAVTALQTAFNNFPTAMQTCSNLASN